MSSGHFNDFAPVVWSAPPPTYPDAYTGQDGRWFKTNAGILWTDDKKSLGLDTSEATDWDLVSGIRLALAEQFVKETPATDLFNKIQAELDPEEWFEGPVPITA